MTARGSFKENSPKEVTLPLHNLYWCPVAYVPNTTHKEAFSHQGPPWLSCLFSLSSSTPSAPAMQGFPSHDSTFAHTVPSARCPALFLHFYPGHPAHMSPPVRCFLSTLRESQGSSLSSHGSRILFPFPPLCLCHGRVCLLFRSTRRSFWGMEGDTLFLLSPSPLPAQSQTRDRGSGKSVQC